METREDLEKRMEGGRKEHVSYNNYLAIVDAVNEVVMTTTISVRIASLTSDVFCAVFTFPGVLSDRDAPVLICSLISWWPCPLREPPFRIRSQKRAICLFSL